MKLTCTTAVFNAIKSGNREKLVRCVESVAKLKSTHEHLIYDGASTDGTVELLRELEAKTPGLKVVSERDTGIYNALNKGVRDAKGQWFSVLGCDDCYAHPEVLDSVLETIPEDAKLVMSSVPCPKGYCFLSGPKDVRYIFCSSPFAHMGMLMDVALVRKFGGFDEKYKIGADQDLFLKLFLSGAKFHIVYDQFAIFTAGGTSAQNPETGRKDILDIFKNNFQLTDKQITLFDKKGFHDPSAMIRYLNSDNWVLRKGARYMLWVMTRYYLRIWFYPLVMLRHVLKGDYVAWQARNRKQK